MRTSTKSRRHNRDAIAGPYASLTARNGTYHIASARRPGVDTHPCNLLTLWSVPAPGHRKGRMDPMSNTPVDGTPVAATPLTRAVLEIDEYLP